MRLYIWRIMRRATSPRSVMPLRSQYVSGRRVLLLLVCFSVIGHSRSTAQITVDFSSPPPSPQAKTGLTVEDVIKLSKAGLSDDVIIAQIKKRPQPFNLSTDQLIQLKSAKVSDRVIQAMTESQGVTENAPGSAGQQSADKNNAATVSGPDLKTAAEGSAPKALESTINDPLHVRTLADGFYYKAPESWQRLEPIMMSGGGAKHMGKMFVPGLTPQVVWTFRGAAAPIQISEKRPTFYVKELPSLTNIAGRSGRDLVIVRFDKKKDHRELQVTNGGNMFTFKAGLSKDRVPDIQVKTISDGIFSVTPNEDLKPGEYLLTFEAMGGNGCDFGIKQ